MTTVTFDTLKFVNRLEQAGLTRAQASEFAEAQKEVFEESLAGTFATKSDYADLGGKTDKLAAELCAEMKGLAAELRAEMKDLATELRAEMKDLATELRAEMKDLAAELRAEMKDLAAELRGEMAALRAELATMRWMLGVIIALAIANFAKQFF